MIITETNFIETIRPAVIAEQQSCILLFSASWCGPCNQLHETIDSVVSSRQSNVTIYEIDVDESDVLVEEYEIHNMPTMVVFKDGVVINFINGNISSKDVEKLINELEE